MLQYIKNPKVIIAVFVLVLATIIFFYTRPTGPKPVAALVASTALQQGANNLVLSDNQGNLSQIAFPKGIIVIWSGSQNQVPTGWALCNGENGTPDFRGRFLVGVNPDDKQNVQLTKYNPGDKGGLENVKLTVDEMPNHSHTITSTANIEECPKIVPSDNKYNICEGYTHESKTKGGDRPHENRPPYYAVAYIMKL